MLNTKAITAVTAGTGLVMPVWLPSLQQASTVAATLVPIASLIWLLTQIVLAIRTYRRGRNAPRD